MLTTDRKGTPLSALLDSAQKSEVRLAPATIKKIDVPVRPLHSRTRPKRICADKAYDAKWLREELTKRNIGSSIPKRRKAGVDEFPKMRPEVKRDYKERWVVERTIGWLGWFRRLVVRWERLITVYRGFFNIACMLVCLRQVLK